MAVINIKNASKTYGSGEIKVEALKPANFEVERGEFVCIIGTSGSGKSTLMHLMAGVDTATSGEIIINGKDVTKLDQEHLAIFRRREVGIIYQFFNLVPVLTAKENIELPLMLDDKKVNRQYFNEIVELLGIKNRLDFYPSKMSGGEQQRVAIARALIHKPSIILADEPTGNLNSKLAKEIMEFLVLASKKYNQTIVMITHDLKLASYADRIIEIQDGNIVRDEKITDNNQVIVESDLTSVNKDEILQKAQEKLSNIEFSISVDEEYEKWDKYGNYVIDYNEMLRIFFFMYNEDLKDDESKKYNKLEDISKTYFELLLEATKAFENKKTIIVKNMKKNKVVKEITKLDEYIAFVDTFDSSKWMVTSRKNSLIALLSESANKGVSNEKE